MKHILSTLIAALFVTGLFVSGAAYSGEKEGMKHEGMEGKEGMEYEGKEKHKEMHGAHKMSGTIREIDKETGTLTLDSKPAQLKLHFPPDSIKDLKEGDEITVKLGFKKSEMEPAETAPKE